MKLRRIFLGDLDTRFDLNVPSLDSHPKELGKCWFKVGALVIGQGHQSTVDMDIEMLAEQRKAKAKKRGKNQVVSR